MEGGGVWGGEVKKKKKIKNGGLYFKKESIKKKIKRWNIDSSGDITTDVPMEHVVNHLRKKNRNFRRNVSDVHIIKGMVIVFLVCES